MVARLVDRGGERVRVVAPQHGVDRLHAGEELAHRPRPRVVRVRDDLLAGAAVEPRVVEDPVVPGETAGHHRRVVGERDRREPGHRTVLVRGAHLEQAGDVRRTRRGRPCRRARWSSCRRRGRRRRGAAARPKDRAASVRTSPSWPARCVAVGVGRAARAARGASARRRPCGPTRGTRPSARTPLPASSERRPGLDDPERAVLAAVAALVLPVVRGRVQDAEVGRGRVVEELRDVVVGEGVGVLAPVGVRVGELVGRAGVKRSVDRSASGSAPLGPEDLEPGAGRSGRRPPRAGSGPTRRG